MKLTIKTKVLDNGNIDHEMMDDFVGSVMRDVIQTKEAATRQALISMGWTPPPDKTAPERPWEDVTDLVTCQDGKRLMMGGLPFGTIYDHSFRLRKTKWGNSDVLIVEAKKIT